MNRKTALLFLRIILGLLITSWILVLLFMPEPKGLDTILVTWVTLVLGMYLGIKIATELEE